MGSSAAKGAGRGLAPSDIPSDRSIRTDRLARRRVDEAPQMTSGGYSPGSRRRADYLKLTTEVNGATRELRDRTQGLDGSNPKERA